MEPIETYDIITLENGEEYVVVKILNRLNKKYFLLAWVDEEENPDLENIKIVEEIIKDNKTTVEEVDDEELLKQLSNEFLSSLKETLD